MLGSDKDKINIPEQILTEYSRISHRPLHIFNNADDCYNFVLDSLCADENTKCIVFLLDQLACEIISDIVFCEQIEEIIIIDESSLTDQERESMKAYSKVKLCSEKATASTTTPHAEQKSDQEITQEERFNEPIAIVSAFADEAEENLFFHTSVGQRSSERLYSSTTIFRYFMLKLLLEMQAMPSDMDNLIALFQAKLSVSEKSINEFRENYRADRAIQFYTKCAHVFEGLNGAFRSINTNYLLQFRFVLKDIHAQLATLMTHELDDQARKVYRGQKIHFVEMLDLFNSFTQKAPIVVNSFLSTSLDRKTAIGFLGASGYQSSMMHVGVLFTIHIRKEDASFDCPFADISKLGTFNAEKEVLFTPNHMFMIKKFEAIYENESFFYSIEMNIHKETEFRFDSLYNRLKGQWKEQTDNSLLHFAQLLLMCNRYDHPKEIYEQMLNETSDDQTKMVCYGGLARIATFMNNGDEAIAYLQKWMGLEYGNENSFPMPDGILIPTDLAQSLSTFSSRAENHLARASLDQPLNEMSNYLKSNEANEFIQQIPKLILMLAKTFMSNQQYQMAIASLEPVITIMRLTTDVAFDPLVKSKCYQTMAYCYRQLNLNEKALKNYNLALDKHITLPPEQRIEILHHTGEVLVTMNEWKTALQSYIQAAEIYQTELPNENPDKIVRIEECIHQVISHILSSNE